MDGSKIALPADKKLIKHFVGTETLITELTDKRMGVQAFKKLYFSLF